MTDFIGRMTRSISAKLIITIGLLFLLGCGISWYVLITSERNALMKDALDYTASYSDLIQRSIHHSMLAVHREAIQRTIENIGAEKNIKIVRIFDDHGRIFFSSRPEEIDTKINGRSVSSVEALASTAGRWKVYRERRGNMILSYSAPIYNEPACFSAACHFHRKDERVLGTLQTDFSLQMVDRSIWTQAVHTTAFAIAFLLLTSVIMFFFVWKFVHKPVALLIRNMKRIATGDLSQRVPLSGEDEIGQLAGTFNKMSEDLEKTVVSRDALITEIEERKRIEERLQKSEQFVNDAFDSINDPFVIVDEDFKITRTNEAYSRMQNIPMKDLIGRRCNEIIHKKGKKGDMCDDWVVSRTFLSGDPCASEISILQEGTETWYQIYTYPIRSAAGEVSHVIEYYRDITDRKVAERAARAAYDEVDQIFNTAADGMCVIDKDFNLQRVNKTFLEMFGTKGMPVIGKKCYETLPGPECHTSRCPLTIISGGEKILLQFESEKLRMDRESFPCLVFATAFLGEGSELMGVVENIKDITERKRMENELRNMSLKDELTGLYNRRGFYALAEQELKMSNRRKKGIYLLYVDLDGFKEVNDTLGHKEGDRVLKDTAELLQATFRSSDIVARLGGDEFVVVPIGTEGGDVATVIARLQKNIDLHNSGQDLKYKLSMSTGAAYYDPEAPSSIDELLASADKSMYDNKRKKKSS